MAVLKFQYYRTATIAVECWDVSSTYQDVALQKYFYVKI